MGNSERRVKLNCELCLTNKDIVEPIQEVQRLLPSLSRGEKAQVLKWVVQELGDDFPGIDFDPRICGGDPCIARTRIPVWLLERYRRLGVTERDLLDSYPSLRAEDLANAWAYAGIHSADIEDQIRANDIEQSTAHSDGWRDCANWGLPT